MAEWLDCADGCEPGQLECVRALLEVDADVAQAQSDGYTALMAAIRHGHVECVRANVMQLRNDGTCVFELACAHSFGALQLLCAYAPSREAVRAHLGTERTILAVCAQWLEATRRWTSPPHHFELLPLERVRALLVEDADVRAGDGGAGARTTLSLATARLQCGDGSDYGRAALIVRAAAPWSPRTHALFPAGAKARGRACAARLPYPPVRLRSVRPRARPADAC